MFAETGYEKTKTGVCVCVYLSLCMWSQGQWSIMTCKESILTQHWHTSIDTHTHTQASRCHSYCRRADLLVSSHMSAPCHKQCRSFTAADVPWHRWVTHIYDTQRHNTHISVVLYLWQLLCNQAGWPVWLTMQTYVLWAELLHCLTQNST